MTENDKAPIFEGFTRAQLEAAFKAVQPVPNWKFHQPGVWINEADLAVTTAAVVFFAGGGLQVIARASGTALISFPGYYSLIGA